MTEISEAAREKAYQQFWNECWPADFLPEPRAKTEQRPLFNAFARFIQEVSDAAKEVTKTSVEVPEWCSEKLAPFILPEPVDPGLEKLSKAMVGAWGQHWSLNSHAFNQLSEVIAEHGLKIVEDKS